MFVLTFALGASPGLGLFLPESFPNRICAKAMAFCMSMHWVINFFVGLLFLCLLEQLGPQLLYSIFASICMMEEFGNKVTKLQQTPARSNKMLQLSKCL
ncbi:hypothetical protein ES319_A10G151400v1 [Gossypium barbadense]|uniref:Major facilitator superfamily (MFS) profile domain-containing protein n=2 Tax=Gossypium TaxID=3633 RepID=A0A5J5U773_GOSBA|nr:hypothetical protein ES319_A10G151400v1 [Gossypium barbadense]KAB2062429.1 hypothetical protein ES319_A10G151400v1 [Gossypium barbadense]TYG99102.1 hypothetical protein ES288_A10G169000v1 [Gossypium darwinii]